MEMHKEESTVDPRMEESTVDCLKKKIEMSDEYDLLRVFDPLDERCFVDPRKEVDCLKEKMAGLELCESKKLSQRAARNKKLHHPAPTKIIKKPKPTIKSAAAAAGLALDRRLLMPRFTDEFLSIMARVDKMDFDQLLNDVHYNNNRSFE